MQPVNSITTAMPLDVRMAVANSFMKINGAATGKVVVNTQRNTAKAPSQSCLARTLHRSSLIGLAQMSVD